MHGIHGCAYLYIYIYMYLWHSRCCVYWLVGGCWLPLPSSFTRWPSVAGKRVEWRYGGQLSLNSSRRGWEGDSGTRSATSPLCLVSNLLLLVELCHGRMHIYAVNYNL